MDTGACYGVKKCAETVFRKGKMINGEGLAVLEEKNGCIRHKPKGELQTSWIQKVDKIDAKRAIERVKK